MASKSLRYQEDEPEQPGGLLHGPSDGLREWADWVLEVRRRWHEDDPPPRLHPWRWVTGGGALLLGLTALIERLIGG
jgi:hypothetical protein